MARARVVFTSDGDEPTTYQLDEMVAWRTDMVRKYPDATFLLEMSSRDRAQAIGLLRFVLAGLEDDRS